MRWTLIAFKSGYESSELTPRHPIVNSGVRHAVVLANHTKTWHKTTQRSHGGSARALPGGGRGRGAYLGVVVPLTTSGSSTVKRRSCLAYVLTRTVGVVVSDRYTRLKSICILNVTACAVCATRTPPGRRAARRPARTDGPTQAPTPAPCLHAPSQVHHLCVVEGKLNAVVSRLTAVSVEGDLDANAVWRSGQETTLVVERHVGLWHTEW